MLVRHDRALVIDQDPPLFSSFRYGGPSVLSIAMALAVALLVGSRRIPLATVMQIGFAFEILGSYGIAAAEFLSGLDVVSPGNVT